MVGCCRGPRAGLLGRVKAWADGSHAPAAAHCSLWPWPLLLQQGCHVGALVLGRPGTLGSSCRGIASLLLLAPQAVVLLLLLVSAGVVGCMFNMLAVCCWLLG